MALRTSKITSEIIQTCNKYFSSSAEATLKNRLPSTINNEIETSMPSRPYRYKIANTEKPQGLPQLSFRDEGTALFSELQPSANPEFRFDFNPPKWAEKPTDNSPFPASIKQKPRLHLTYSDQQKAEDKLVKCKMVSFNPVTRHFSTSTARLSRAPADNSSQGNCKQKPSRCVKVKRECKLSVNKSCPRFKIRDCKQSKGSNCELRYMDPHCVKKFAPYPSYSEACAETLPDDPSECQQCPWRTCDGADEIKPGKPVRHKRHYSTSCNQHFEATGGVVVGPLLPPTLPQVQELICDKCGVTKSPCKQPPGPCEVRRQREEKNRHNKSKQHEGSKKKKASDMRKRMILRNDENILNLLKKPCNLDPLRILENQNVLVKSSWVDLYEGPQVLLDKKQKHPNCHKKKKGKRPKGAHTDELLLFKPEMLLKDKKGDKKRIKGDEGHPPPCQDNIENSKNCPEKPLKKPKYKKRPMNNSYYKRPEDPYSPSE